MMNYFKMPLGVDSTPFGSKKCIAPLVGAALVSGAGSLLSGLFGASSQSSANETNLQMNRETNEMNYKISQEANQMSQAQFNRNMEWLREQYYDTRQYQRAVQGAKMAGLNPALALGSVSPVGSVGQASPTSFHAAQMEAGHVDPLSYDAIGEGVGIAANAFFDNQLKQSQSENIKADTKTKDISNMTQFARDLAALHNLWEDIENKKSQRGLTDAQRKHYDMMSDELDGKIKLFWTQFEALSDAPKKSNRLLDAQYDETESRTVLNKIEAELKPMLARANVNLSNAQASNLLEQIRLVEPQIQNLIKDGTLKSGQAVAQKLANMMNSLDLNTKARMSGIYDSNKITRGIADVFQMLGDLLFGQVKFGFSGKY